MLIKGSLFFVIGTILATKIIETLHENKLLFVRQRFRHQSFNKLRKPSSGEGKSEQAVISALSNIITILIQR